VSDCDFGSGILKSCAAPGDTIDKKNTYEDRITDMPHKCTNCEHIFEDGSADILNGCPNCGWNKFLYVPAKPATGTETDAKDTDAPMQSDKVEEEKETVPDMEVESIRTGGIWYIFLRSSRKARRIVNHRS
jgi:DNA-directed RNA polymerase subunit RPC12/RpoP